MRTFLGGRFASVREKFFDNFTRPNSVGLGISTDGSNWTPVNGSLNISTNQAVSPNNTNYPIATVTMPTVDNTVELTGTNQGSSAAIWVQGSSDWYLVGQDRTVTYYDYTYNYTTSGTGTGQATGTANTYSSASVDVGTGNYVTYTYRFYF